MKKRRSILGRRKRTGGARKAWNADCPRQRSRDAGTACREDPQRTARRAINNSGISHLGYPEHSCDEHWDARIFVNYDFLQMECPEVGLQGQTVALFLAFLKKPAWWSPQWLYRFTFSPRVGGFPFLHTFSSIYFYRLFNDGHSDWCEVIPHCGLGLHFSKQTEWPLTEEWIHHVFFICLSLSIFIHLLYLSL